ncbi:unnamed protein product [Caenorhabditis brenneri]
MDFCKFYEYGLFILLNLTLFTGAALTAFQCCSKKPKHGYPDQDDSPPAEIVHSDRSSDRRRKPRKSTSKSPDSVSPSPSRKSGRASRKTGKTVKRDTKKRRKHKHRHPKSSEKKIKDEEAKSPVEKPIPKFDDLQVMSTQPSHPSSSDPDSIATAKIEVITFPYAKNAQKQIPLPKNVNSPSKENVEVEPIAKKGKKPSREAVVRKPSSEAYKNRSNEATRKASKEALTEDPLKMKPSQECEKCDNSAPTASETGSEQNKV